MSDLIDRQMAIDAILTELTKRERKNLLHTWSTVEVKYFVTGMLELLPSAQPTQKNESNTLDALDCVSRKAAIDALNEVSEHYTEKGREWHPHVNFMISAIEDLPSAQPEIKPKEGRWSKSDDGYECSECEWYSLYDSPWCPWCGAKMEVLRDE